MVNSYEFCLTQARAHMRAAFQHEAQGFSFSAIIAADLAEAWFLQAHNHRACPFNALAGTSFIAQSGMYFYNPDVADWQPRNHVIADYYEPIEDDGREDF